MPNENLNVLLLSPDACLATAIGRQLGDGFVTQVETELQFQKLNAVRESYDVLVLDLLAASTGGDCEPGLRLMDEMAKLSCHPPMVVLCDEENGELALTVMERGAFDTVTTPPNMVELRLVLRRASKFYAAERELQNLRANARNSGRLHELLGTSAAMQELFSLAQKIAPCDVSVLITGETGTGKELLARAIHHMSPRSARPIVAFSCANLPESLIEDELFGHERGAFTGALAQRRGRVEASDHSTLFLDEIGDLGLGLQPKLLRVLQERSFERLGSNNPVNVDTRLICATNRNLPELVQQGKFREDLYYRLNVVEMHLPSLRERRDDIPLLAQHFLVNCAEQFKKKAKRFSQPALHALEEYAWPGNVRELSNAVQRAVVLSDGATVEAFHLPAALRGGDAPQVVRSYEQEVREFKRRLVLRTLRECGWRKAESARTLGLARGYLHRLIHQLGIQQLDEKIPVEAHIELAPTRVM
jgi:DNA-binding NtrC family response regulator